jgi:hypothetical protein
MKLALLDERGVENLEQHLYSLKYWDSNVRHLVRVTKSAGLAAYGEQPYRVSRRIIRGRRAWAVGQRILPREIEACLLI